MFPENWFDEATEVLPQAFSSLVWNKVMFNRVVYFTVLTQVCIKFIQFVEISISGEISGRDLFWTGNTVTWCF